MHHLHAEHRAAVWSYTALFSLSLTPSIMLDLLHCYQGRTLKAALGLLPAAVCCPTGPVPSCTQGLELSSGHLHPTALGYHL